MRHDSVARLRAILYLIVFGIVLFYGYKFIFEVECPSDRPRYDIQSALEKENIVPVAIIGSGPAGLSAALYGARGGFHTVIFEGPNPGGQLMGTSWVENWPGMPKKMGPELIRSSREQAQEFGAVVVSETIMSANLKSWPFVLKTESGKTIHALSIVIATGATPRRLGVPGEEEYWGKGVTTCAICDAPFYKDSEVFVVGGGDSAAEEAMQLAPYARKITMLVRGDSMRASASMQERLKAYDHISVRYQTKIISIKGNGKHVTHADVTVAGDNRTVPVDGIFLAIGHTPNSSVLRDQVAMDKDGYVVLKGHTQKTSVPGVFAAGDVEDRVYRQAGIAAGEGIKAALDSADFLRDMGYSDAVAEKLVPNFFDGEGGVGRVALPELVSLGAFERELSTSEVPLFLDFYTEFCPTCMQMLPSIELLSGSLKDEMKFFKVDAMKAQQLAEKFEVETVPTFIIVKDGELVARAQSTMSPQELRAFVDQALR